jgi:hypothetical protein
VRKRKALAKMHLTKTTEKTKKHRGFAHYSISPRGGRTRPSVYPNSPRGAVTFPIKRLFAISSVFLVVYHME